MARTSRNSQQRRTQSILQPNTTAERPWNNLGWNWSMEVPRRQFCIYDERSSWPNPRRLQWILLDTCTRRYRFQVHMAQYRSSPAAVRRILEDRIIRLSVSCQRIRHDGNATINSTNHRSSRSSTQLEPSSRPSSTIWRHRTVRPGHAGPALRLVLRQLQLQRTIPTKRNSQRRTMKWRALRRNKSQVSSLFEARPVAIARATFWIFSLSIQPHKWSMPPLPAPLK